MHKHTQIGNDIKNFKNIHKMCHLARSKMKDKGRCNNFTCFWYIFRLFTNIALNELCEYRNNNTLTFPNLTL